MKHKTNTYKEILLSPFNQVLLFLLTIIGLSSCDEKENLRLEKDQPVELILDIRGIHTRAFDDAFADFDQIGLYAVKWTDDVTPGNLLSSGNHIDNQCFTYNEGEDGWTAETPVYYPADGSKLDLFGYYPYRNPLLNANTTVFDFKVHADQSEYSNYTLSDLAVVKKEGISRSTQKVDLAFDHKLSQLVFTLNAGDGFTAQEIAQSTIRIKNALIEVSYDLADGKEGIPVDGTERADIIPNGAWQISETNPSLIYGYKAIIAPQELNSSTYLEIQLGSRTFTYKFNTPVTMQSGESRTFTITLNNTTVELQTTLNPWNYGEPIEGEATEEEEESGELFIERIATSGTWIVPEGVKTLEIFLVSGGGGGGGWNNWGYSPGGSGGGGGSLTRSKILENAIPVTPGDIATITIGTGGTGGRGYMVGGRGEDGEHTIFAINGVDYITEAVGGGGSGAVYGAMPAKGQGGNQGHNGLNNNSTDENIDGNEEGWGEACIERYGENGVREFWEEDGLIHAAGGHLGADYINLTDFTEGSGQSLSGTYNGETVIGPRGGGGYGGGGGGGSYQSGANRGVGGKGGDGVCVIRYRK